MTSNLAVVTQLTRVFRYNGFDSEDPNPALTPEEVVSILARTRPKLLGAKVVPPIIEGGDKYVFELRSFGDKG